jgi:hypothetical protein
MHGSSATTNSLANQPASKVGPSLYQSGSTHFLVVEKIKEMYREQTVPTLAAWLKLTIKTAKNRLCGERYFSLEEIERLLHSDQGFEILSALMSRAPRKPHWWAVCEPLMEFASIEQMQVIIRERVAKAVQEAAHANDVVTQELRRAQTAAICDPEFTQPRLDALHSYAGADRRVVAAKKR